jgi:glucose/arabinose dehydrogenase
MQRADHRAHGPRRRHLHQPRLIRTAPNGDLFLADSGAGTIFVLRGVGPDGKAAQIEKFATGLDHPFGIAFYPAENPKYVYVGNATGRAALPYHSGDLHATGPAETIVPDIPGYAQLTGGGHWTRDVVFTKDGQHMLVSVGSGSNVDDADTHPREFHRADVLEYTPEGKFVEVYATASATASARPSTPPRPALVLHQRARQPRQPPRPRLRHLSVPEGSFFGWPWYYMGGHQDPRLPDPCANGTGPNPQLTAPLTADQARDCKRVDMSAKVARRTCWCSRTWRRWR